MKGPVLRLLCLSVFLVAGCAKPDHVVTIRSPDPGLFYTVETYYGHGAVSNDSTSVYAHLEVAGGTDKKLVLDGEYLENSQVVWTGKEDVTVCVTGGVTSSFRNEVTLSAAGVSKTIRNHLQEHC